MKKTFSVKLGLIIKNMENSMDLSIIIVNWNTKKILQDCLNSIYKYTRNIDYEIIVIDNHSSDGSVEMLKSEFDKVRLIANDDNKGFAAANNQGMEIAKGRYLLLLNSDTLLIDNALQKAVQFADLNPKAGIVGCRVLNPDFSLQPTCFMYPGLMNLTLSAFWLNKLFPKSKIFGRERMTWWLRDDEREVEVITGCFMLARRQAVESVGYMDDSFFMYGEETDWCYRFKNEGWKLLFTPDYEIIHLGGQSSKQIKPMMILQLKSGILKFINKQHTKKIYTASKIAVAFWFFIRIPVWFFHDLIHDSNFTMTKTYCKGTKMAFGGWKSLEMK